MRLCILSVVSAVVFSFPSFAATVISDTASLAANSDISDPGVYLLDPGQSYVFGAPITLRGQERGSIAFAGTGQTVFLENTLATPLLTVDAFTLSNGAALVVSAAGADAYGLQANSLAITGPTSSITAQGGTGTGAQGIRVDRQGFLQYDGTVSATGGSGNGADGIHVLLGGYTMEEGVLATTGGTASSAAGIRVAAGGFTMNGGTATARGGTESNASGIWVSGGDFVMNGGHMTAYGGTTGNPQGNAHGIRVNGAALQTGGTMVITGGGTTYSVGLYTGGDVTLSGGEMTVTGGTGNSASGINTNGNTMTVANTGKLTVTAGTAGNAHGIFTNTLVQADGSIDAFGAGTGGVHGISGNTFRQTGGTLTARASDTVDSRGLSFNSTTQEGGSITAYGGGYNSGFSYTGGFFTSSLTQRGGEITGYGGSGNGARGVLVNNTLTQAGGITAFGGLGEASYGVSAQTWNMERGSITATGGDGNRAVGAYASVLTMAAGDIEATGGGGDGAHGISGSAFTMANGSVTGSGGGVSGANGVNFNSITMNAGIMTGSSGTVSGAHGVYAVGLTQNGGGVVARGGTVDGAYGFRVGAFTQSDGMLTAVGGSSARAYGMYASSTMSVGGSVRLERPERAAASVYVDGNLTFRSGSVLVPVVDLDDLDGDTGSGLIQTSAGSTVTVDSGARLNPFFLGTRSMAKNVISTDYLFLDTQGGVINGAFADQGGSLAIVYEARKINNDSQYVLTYERVLDTEEVMRLIPCVNSRRLVDVFAAANDPADALAREVLQSVDMAGDLGELARTAAHIGRTLTPIAYTKLTNTQLRTMELVQGSLFRQLDGLAAVSGGVESGAAWPSLAWNDRKWRTWSSGLYQQSSRFASRCGEFDSPKEKLYGLDAGLSRDFGRLAVAGSFSYVRGTYASGYSDITVDNYGLTLGGKMHDIVPSGGWFAPWASLVGGYAYGDISQKIRNYTATGWKKSSPSANMFRTSAELGNDFRFGRLFTLTPIVGLDYACIRQGGYRENDPAGNGLRVTAGSYNSLRPRAGLALGYQTRALSLGLNAFYRYETMDGKSTFMYSRLSTPGVILPVEGEKRKRFSGSVGATAAYQVTDRLSINGTYDLILEDGYTASRFSVGVGLSF